MIKEGRAIVCEGQIDIIAAYEAGVENVIAPLGTAFTEHHAKMLRSRVQEVVLCFDSDNAGYKAAERSYQILSPEGLVVRVASLPKGEDPDSMIRKHGAEAFTQAVGRAVEFLDFQIAHKRSTQGTDIRQQVQLIEQTAVTIAMNPSISARDLMITSHAGTLGVTEDALRRQVEQFVRRRKKSEEKAEESAERPPTTAEEARKLVESQQSNALYLVGLALVEPTVLEWLRLQDIEELLHDLPGTELLRQVWLAHFPAGDEKALSLFLSGLSPVEAAAFTQVVMRSHPKGGIEEAWTALEAMRTSRLDHLIRRAKAQMKQPDVSPERVEELQKLLIDWHKEYLDRRKMGSDTP